MKETIILPTYDAIEFPDDAHQAEALKLFTNLSPIEMMQAITFWYDKMLAEGFERFEIEPVETGHICPYCAKPIMNNEDTTRGSLRGSRKLYHLACVERKLENERRFQGMAG